jgi:hypothetical protein
MRRLTDIAQPARLDSLGQLRAMERDRPLSRWCYISGFDPAKDLGRFKGKAVESSDQFPRVVAFKHQMPTPKLEP